MSYKRHASRPLQGIIMFTAHTVLLYKFVVQSGSASYGHIVCHQQIPNVSSERDLTASSKYAVRLNMADEKLIILLKNIR